MEMIGLALLYPAREWSVCAPGHHGYPRASDLILGKALRGRLGHQITTPTYWRAQLPERCDAAVSPRSSATAQSYALPNLLA